MDLQKISDAKTGMEDMMNCIYDLQEAVETKDSKQIKLTTELFKEQAYMLNLVLMRTVVNKQNVSIVERRAHVRVLGKMVCDVSGFTVEELKASAKCRKRQFVLPRQVHMAFAVKTFRQTTTVAGNLYGKDHATCLSAIKVVRNLWQTDASFREEYSDILEYCFEYDSHQKTTNTIDYLTSDE